MLERVAAEKQAKLFTCPMDKVKINRLDEYGAIFDFQFKGRVYEDIEISLLGEYQVYNAVLAIYNILTLRDRECIHITEKEIRDGLKKTKWKGRLEIISRNPTFLIDGAHNLQGVNNLAKNLNLFNYNRLILGLGILKDKDVNHMVEVLSPLADEIVITEVNMPRKMDAYDLEKITNKYNKNTFVERDIEKAIDKTFEMADEEDLILFAGSLYLIGDVRRILTKSK